MDLLQAPLLNIDINQISTSPTTHIFHDEGDYILNMLLNIRHEYDTKMANYFLVMKNLLYSIIISSVRQIYASDFQVAGPTTIIKDYVSLHYPENDILNHISAISHYSAQYLSSRFKADTGETFKSYLQRIRCNVAEQLMTSANMSINDIAESVGYKDIKYFQEIFKKHKNITPKKLKTHFDRIYNRK